ncbi:MAG: cardiolipin synthase ClsB [Pseudomonadota bacterium]|nr:cardiolipin synthase ClsB [Pseudomonadota bacterium]
MAEHKRRAASARALQAGHSIELLKGGEELFPALVACIDTARAEVLVETYIFDFAGSPLAVAEALERAAARHVSVRIIVDGIGTGEIPGEWRQRWGAAGVQWRIFKPASGWRLLLPSGWRRLHRKLAVVDGTVAFCGGINLLDDYRDPSHGPLEQPRFDFAVRVTGPLVAQAHETMTRLWRRVEIGREARQFDFKAALDAVRAAARAGTDMRDAEMTAGDFAHSVVPPAQGLLAGLVVRDNLRFRKRIEHFYRYAIGQARHEVLIANAYFVPGVALQRALIRAAKRGVKVTLLLQGRYEYFMQHHTSRAMYGVMLDAGVEIFEYEPSFLHAKVAIFDSPQGAIATVGSSNLDPISLLLAREANVFVRDDDFAAGLRAHLSTAMSSVGVRVESHTHRKRGLAVRVLAWLAYTMMRIALFATRHRY